MKCFLLGGFEDLRKELIPLITSFQGEINDFIWGYLGKEVLDCYPIASGSYATVFDLENGDIVRVSRDVIHFLPNHPRINPRKAWITLPEYGNLISLEIFKKLEVHSWYKNRRNSEAQHARADILKELTSASIPAYDVYANNIGWDDDEKIWKIVDPGCIIINGPVGTMEENFQFAYPYRERII